MAYATYEQYRLEYYGDKIKEAGFPALSSRASAHIDLLTGGRAREGMHEAALACCAVADVLYDEQEREKKTLGGAVASESVGRHSVAYASDTANAETDTVRLSRRVRAAAALYLADTGFLFRGAGV